MHKTQLSEEQIFQIWEICNRMAIKGLPQTGDYEDIRQNVFIRALSTANVTFLLKNDVNFERAARQVLRSALKDEIKHLKSQQLAFENGMVQLSTLETSDDGEATGFDSADPRTTNANYFPAWTSEWEVAVEALANRVREKAETLPRHLRRFARELADYIPLSLIALRMGKNRVTLHRWRKELQVIFAAEWEQYKALMSACD